MEAEITCCDNKLLKKKKRERERERERENFIASEHKWHGSWYTIWDFIQSWIINTT